MKQVFHLNITIEDIKVDLYFEDQDTAERMMNFMNEVLTKKAKKKLKVVAQIHEVYTKETAVEQIMEGFGMAEDGMSKRIS